MVNLPTGMFSESGRKPENPSKPTHTLREHFKLGIDSNQDWTRDLEAFKCRDNDCIYNNYRKDHLCLASVWVRLNAIRALNSNFIVSKACTLDPVLNRKASIRSTKLLLYDDKANQTNTKQAKTGQIVLIQHRVLCLHLIVLVTEAKHQLEDRLGFCVFLIHPKSPYIALVVHRFELMALWEKSTEWSSYPRC